MEYNVHTLPNGIRLLHVPSASAISHACIIVNSGSRDETADQAGLAHFIEHLIFKRTEKRSTNQILSRLEDVGADLNAYTTKEYTCIHASLLNPHLERTIDLFEDILFHSTFPEEELENIFSAFVTTKPDGLGLGLAVCRTIIDAHGGRLWATNNPGGGASLLRGWGSAVSAAGAAIVTTPSMLLASR